MLLCSHKSSDPNFSYLPTLNWNHNEAALKGQNLGILELRSLSLSHVGNYTCKVTGISLLFGISICGRSVHEIILPGIPKGHC